MSLNYIHQKMYSIHISWNIFNNLHKKIWNVLVINTEMINCSVLCVFNSSVPCNYTYVYSFTLNSSCLVQAS